MVSCEKNWAEGLSVKQIFSTENTKASWTLEFKQLGSKNL